MKPKDLLDAESALTEAGLSGDWSILLPFVPNQTFDTLDLVPRGGRTTYEQLSKLYGLFKPDELSLFPITGPFSVAVRLRWHT